MNEVRKEIKVTGFAAFKLSMHMALIILWSVLLVLSDIALRYAGQHTTIEAALNIVRTILPWGIVAIILTDFLETICDCFVNAFETIWKTGQRIYRIVRPAKQKDILFLSYGAGTVNYDAILQWMNNFEYKVVIFKIHGAVPTKFKFYK